MLHRALLLVLVVCSLVAPQEATTSSTVEKELRQRTQELLDAVAPGRSHPVSLVRDGSSSAIRLA